MKDAGQSPAFPLAEGSMRADFEAWVSAPPFEKDTRRFPNQSDRFAWPDQYRSYEVELAWEAWQAASNTKNL